MCLLQLKYLNLYFALFFKCVLIYLYILDEIKKYNTINRNMFKPPVSEKVKELVRRNFTREIEFYEFCKQRLHQQFQALG